MPDDRQREQLEEQLANEVAQLRDLAVRSIDPLIVAKAVAASDEGVQHLLLARLDAGERLVEVFAFRGAGGSEPQVFFRFAPAGAGIQLVDAGVLAFVDSVKGEVIGTIDPYLLQPEQRVGRPFVSISAVDTLKYAARHEAMKPLADRERTFFENLGVAYLMRRPGYSADTVCDTPVTTVSWSGNPRRQDDTRSEETDDYCDSPGDRGILA